MKNLKFMRRKFKRSAIGWTACEIELANHAFRRGVRSRFWRKSARATGRRERPGNRGRGIAVTSANRAENAASLVRGRHRNQQFERGNPRIEKLYIFGNKARGSRVSYLAAQFGAISSRLAPQGRFEMAKKSFEDRGQELSRRAAARFAIGRAVIVAMLIGPIVGAMLAAASVAAQDTANVITIDNFIFTPPELTVAVGTTVKWVNHDDIPHLVVNKDKVFRSKALDTDDSYSYTFASAGTFDYFCGLHPHMVGKVIVK
jgi:plastocyanin